jgi:hypothetical protein
MCRLCTNYIECNKHIIQCTSCNKREKLRKQYIHNLQTEMIKMGTNSTTIRVISAHLRAWFQETSPPDMNEIAPEASYQLQQAVKEQTSIGWDQWFRGRITRKWGELYNYDIKTPNIIIRRPSALKWGQTINCLNFKFVLEAWHARNENEHDTHGDPILRQKQKICEKIMWEISKIAAGCNQLTMSKEEIMQLPQANLEMLLLQIQMKTKPCEE